MKIFCIGRNYKAHAKELGNDVPTKPVVFMKPPTALTTDERHYYIPTWTDDLHHEVELVVKIKKNGKTIHPKFVNDYYDLIGLGIDFTARDIQSICKENSHPWEIAKAFDNSALISNTFVSYDDFISGGSTFSLSKNDEVIQKGNTDMMIFSIDEIIIYISNYFTLQKGDLIYTGTPAGVSKLSPNDHLKGFINGQEMFNLNIK